MRSDEYCRIHAVCLDMAKQSSVRDVKARWLAMAKDCLELATESAHAIRRSKGLPGQSRLVALEISELAQRLAVITGEAGAPGEAFLPHKNHRKNTSVAAQH
jgi:hypothetical protein